jgi:integrase
MGRPAKPEYAVKKSKKPNGKLSWFIIGRPNGVKKVAWFPTKEKAQAEATERNVKMRKLGQDSAQVDNSLIIMAQAAATQLALHGKTIRDATEHYLTYLNQLNAPSLTVAELCKIVRQEFEFRLVNEGTTLRHKRTMDSELKKFEARFGTHSIKTLTANEIKDWLAALEIAPKTRIKIFGYIRNAYGIAVRKGLLETHPLEKVDNFIRNKKSESPPFPLTPEEAQRLLNAAEPSVLPYIAIGMFAGLRAAERDHLDWKDVHIAVVDPYIDLSAKIAKTGKRRLVPIQPALQAFLAPYAKAEGRIIPLTSNGLVAYRNPWERAVKTAELWPWSENRLRDSFVSYRYEQTDSAEITAKEAGHSVQVMFDKYQKIVTKDAAGRFWAIRPKGEISA